MGQLNLAVDLLIGEKVMQQWIQLDAAAVESPIPGNM